MSFTYCQTNTVPHVIANGTTLQVTEELAKILKDLQTESDLTQAYAERVEKENMENCEKIKQLEAQMSELISSTRIGPGRERQINFRDTFDARYITPIVKNHIQTGQQLRNRNTYTAPLNESTTPAPPSANTQTVPPNVSANTLSRTTSSQLEIGRIVRNWNLKYSGEPGSSIEEFLERVHECRRLTQLTDNDLLNAMSELLTGSARLWARQTQHEWTSWQEFCSAARACFGVDRKFQQVLIKEAQRRIQGDLEPVRSYIFALLTIMSKFEDQWPLEMQLDLLHTNMRPDLQMQVRRSSITSIGQLLERAREAEGIELARRVYQKPPPKETCVMPELASPNKDENLLDEATCVEPSNPPHAEPVNLQTNQDIPAQVEEVNQHQKGNKAAQVEANNWQLVRHQRNDDDNLSNIDDVGVNLDNAQIQQIAGLSTIDEWGLLEKRIMKCEQRHRELVSLEIDTEEWLRDFVNRRGEQGRELAGNFPQRYEDLRETQEEAAKYFNDLQERRIAHEAALQERRAAERELRAYQEETMRTSQELSRRLYEATEKLKNCTVGKGKKPQRKAEQQMTHQPTKQCPICGIKYVARGRDCPAVAFHHRFKKQ
ncbi:hypothetical protein TKK_0001659 [Trichogramma kaykai]